LCVLWISPSRKRLKKTSSVVCVENFPTSYKLRKKKPFEIDRKTSLIKKTID
jgi:hypothetical protein